MQSNAPIATDEDVNFQRRMWAVQRLGWVLIGIVVVAALFGTFGTGPLSRASAQAGALRIEYERFARLAQSTRIRVSFTASEIDPQLALSRRYLESVLIQNITPEPAHVAAAGEWIFYRFAVRGPLAVTFSIKPEHFGRITGAAHIPNERAIVFHQFVYP